MCIKNWLFYGKKNFRVYCTDHFFDTHVQKHVSSVETEDWFGMRQGVYKKFRQTALPRKRKALMRSVRSRDSVKRYKRSYELFEKFKPLQSTLPRREDIFSFGQKNRDFSKIEKSRKKQIEKFNLKPESVEYTDEPIENLVGGLDKHIRVLKETLMLPVLYPHVFKRFVKHNTKGILLHGPSGTGKTLLARALVQTSRQFGTEFTFFVRKGPDMLSKFYGDTDKNIRMLFSEARSKSPSVILFDEIDGLCPVRNHKQEQVHNSVVTSLLAEIDGLDDRANNKIIIIATTNRVDQIDPALRRPGRFDRELFVGPPNAKGRKKIFEIHTKKWNEITDEMLIELARRTSGLVGSDIQGICTEAMMLSIRKNIPQLTNKYAQRYHSKEASKKMENLTITLENFEEVLESFIAKKGRNWSFQHVPVSKEIRIKYKETVEILMNLHDIKTFMELTKSKNVKALNEIGVFVSRLLLHGSSHKNSVLRMLLNHFEGVNIKLLEFPENCSQGYQLLRERAIIKVFNSINSHFPSVIIITNINRWMEEGGDRIVNLLESFLLDLQNQKGIISVIATSSRDWTASNVFKQKWSRKIWRFFSFNTKEIRD